MSEVFPLRFIQVVTCISNLIVHFIAEHEYTMITLSNLLLITLGLFPVGALLNTAVCLF